MPYLGAINPTFDPSRALVGRPDVDRFNGDTIETDFTLSKSVLYATDIDVWVDDVHQEPITDYLVSGTTLSFNSPPATGTNNIYVNFRGSTYNNYAVVPDGSITFNKLANNLKYFTEDIFTANGTGSTVELSEEPTYANNIIVSIDGVIQTNPVNYTLSGSTITFTSIPDASAKIAVKHLGFRTSNTISQTIAANSITSAMVQDGAITSDKIADGTVIAADVAANAITTVELANDAVNSNNIVDGAVTNDKLTLSYSSTTETANGTGNTFTVETGHDANSMIVFYNGIALVPVTDYDVSGTTLTTTFTPVANSVLAFRYLPI